MRTSHTQLIPTSEVLELANWALLSRDVFLTNAAKWSADQREELLKRASSLYNTHVDNRDALRSLIKVLHEVSEFQEKQADATRERRNAEEQSVENRRADAMLAKRHPKGDLIGSTQSIGYKSPGEKKHWGTPRKRRR